MHRIVLSMAMSSDELLRATTIGLEGMVGVQVGDSSSRVGPAIDVVISTEDPDYVDIAREVVWQIDPRAIQESVVVGPIESADDDLMVGRPVPSSLASAD